LYIFSEFDMMFSALLGGSQTSGEP